jgi:hypothetical protein
MVGLSLTKEIINCSEADQFQASKSQFECGYFACLMAKSMAPLGKPPTLTSAQVIASAESWYGTMDGNNSSANMDGMSLQQEYDLLAHLQLHYQSIDMSVQAISLWLRAGYPVIVAVGEASVVDVAVGGNPYPWHAAGNHVILLTGIDSNGNYLVRDSANCTNLYDPNSLRPGPRYYVANQLTLVSSTAIVPPWLARPTSNVPPIGAISMALSRDFHDDGKTLTYTPNKHFFVRGFRQTALDAMARGEDPGGWIPLEEEQAVNPVELHNPNGGPGSRQITSGGMLVWTQKYGVHRSAIGLEVMAYIAALKAKK